jgi:putative redox protein
MPAGESADNPRDETIILEETRFGDFQVKVRSGCATFYVDEPFGVGGLASGPNPYDLLSAAIGASSLMIMRLYATQMNLPLEDVRVRVTHSRRGLQAQDIFVKEVQLVGPLTNVQRQAIFEVSNRCPVQLTISRGSEIRTHLLSNEAMDDTATTLCEHARDMREAIQQERRA